MVAKRTDNAYQSDVWPVTFVGESHVVGGDTSGYVRRWKIEDGQQHGPTMRVNNRTSSIVVSQDGRWIVTGDHGRKAIIWNATTHEKVLELMEHEREVCALDISSDCTRMVSVGGDTVRIFSFPSGTRLFPPSRHHWVCAVKFSPDDSRIATVSTDSGIRVYDSCSGKIMFDSGPKGSVSSWPATSPLAWSADGQHLFVGSRGKIKCLNVANSSSSEWSIHQKQSLVSIATNGRFIACSAGTSVSLWDCASHKQIGCIIKHTAETYSVALSQSGKYLACGVGGNITIHNLKDVLLPKYFDHDLPLLRVSNEALESWKHDPTKTEKLLSDEIASASSPSHYVLASRALIRARLKYFAPAVKDVQDSLRVQPSPIGHIAMAIVLLGQGNRGGALCTFDLAFHDCELCDIRFLLLLKVRQVIWTIPTNNLHSTQLILVFESGNREEAVTRVEYLAARASDDNDNGSTYLYTQVLGVMYMEQENYRRAIPLIKGANKLSLKGKQYLPLKTISLVFGWSFNGLDIVAQQRLCESLFAEQRTAEAVGVLLDIIRTLYGEVQGNKATVDWIADFTKKCVRTLEDIGDEAFRSGKYDDAMTQYSAMLSLSLPSPVGLLLKRNRALAAKGLWEDALQDANEAVKTDPSDPWGYEAKHVALHAMRRYDEAIDAFKSMLHLIEQSHDPGIRQLRKNYISPSETIVAIDLTVCEILKSCPLVVIDVTTGCLCHGPERMRIFKADPTFKELILSMTKQLDNERVLRVVASFFGYVMFSHVWQGNEPSFQDVSLVKSVWNLPETPLNEKLRGFCKEARRLGYNWAWSDTCCIDKATSSILNLSLTSMYKWYANSAATVAFLADVAHPSELGDLSRSSWMTRAWTLQELLAPKVMLFYDSEWKPYLGDTSTNHKESPEIMRELANAIKIPHGTIVTFSPNDLGVREKLRLASTRNATVEEDVAYSLIGIFKSDIRPNYGEGADALGHLLEEIVARSGEVTVLGWSGKSSSYNSCLPASIVIYSQTPHNPPSLEGEEMNACVAKLHGELPKKDALSIFKRINSLPAALFAARRLHLPCIIFPVRGLATQEPRRGNEKLYRAEVSGLGNVEFMTADNLPLQKRQELVFVHPWISHIRGPSSWVTWEDDSESDTDSDPGSDSNSRSGAPPDERYAQALQMIARLGQPFSALLLIQQPNREYKRVAAENEIVVSGLGTNITSKNIRAQVLEIL